MSHLPRRTKDERPLSDEQLFALAREEKSPAANEAASALLGRYQERVYRWCYGRVGNHEQAQDLAQDVLLSAHRSLHRFDGQARFSTWLFAIARNRCLNALRRPHLFEEGLEMEEFADGRQSQEERLVQDQDEDRLLALIREHLPPLDRKVLWLRCFDKVPVDGITRLLEITDASGARGILQRARRRLRAALTSLETEEGDGTRD